MVVKIEYWERLRIIREQREYKQKEIAEKLGLTNQQAYQRYESGKVLMPITLLIKIAQLYGVSLDYLVGLTDDKRKYW